MSITESFAATRSASTVALPGDPLLAPIAINGRRIRRHAHIGRRAGLGPPADRRAPAGLRSLEDTGLVSGGGQRQDRGRTRRLRHADTAEAHGSNVVRGEGQAT